MGQVLRHGCRTPPATGPPTAHPRLPGVPAARQARCDPPTRKCRPQSPTAPPTPTHAPHHCRLEGPTAKGTRPRATQLLELLPAALHQSSRRSQADSQKSQRTQTRWSTRSSPLPAPTLAARTRHRSDSVRSGNLHSLPNAAAGPAWPQRSPTHLASGRRVTEVHRPDHRVSRSHPHLYLLWSANLC